MVCTIIPAIIIVAVMNNAGTQTSGIVGVLPKNPPPDALADSTNPFTTAPITTIIGINIETIMNCSEVEDSPSIKLSKFTRLSFASFSAIDLSQSITLVSSSIDIIKLERTFLNPEESVFLI